MTWVLFIYFMTTDGMIEVRAGHMVSQEICKIAGNGAALLYKQTSGAVAGFACKEMRAS